MTPTLDELCRRARALAQRGTGRHVLGICGTPGAGKTTLAEDLVAALAGDPPPGLDAEWVAHVPMDGFHLADVELDRLGRRHAKGAPDTFDAHGYAALLERVRAPYATETIYAPGFKRDLEQPIAGALPVPPACRLVVTEGNYLLLDGSGWKRARACMDEVWFCDVDPDERRRRLVSRHIRFGKLPADAEEWVLQIDEPNARAVEAVADRADLRIAQANLRSSSQSN